MSNCTLSGRVRRAASAVVGFVLPTGAHVVVCGLLALVAGALCFVPLFERIAYESAAAIGLIAGAAAPFLTVRAIDRGVVPHPLEGRPTVWPPAAFAALGLRQAMLVVVPGAMLAANGLRVPVCDLESGLAFWALIPFLSVLLGQGIGWVAAAGIPGRSRWRQVAAGAMLAGSLVWFGLHLALEPPIVGHELLLGYFSGSIYDEALAVPESLIAYRAMNLLWLGAALAAVELERGRRHGRSIGWRAVAVVALSVAAIGLWSQRRELGVGIDRSYIADQLGGRTTTEHFVIHYPQRRRFLEQLDRLRADHEFRYREMADFFETDPARDGKIHSFIYPDRDVKARLMGGRSTMVAKLWLGEIHLLWPRFGHHWLAHELAHVFTAPFGAGPLRLSLQRGVGVNMGLVEGVATAADRPPSELSLHEASAALKRLEMAPDLRTIVGAGGFWTTASRRAYTVAGSFIRFLVERHGIEPFKRAYPRGDVARAYGESVDELVGAWRAFLSSIELSNDEMDRARSVYRESTIFEKTCARRTAELRRRAQRAGARGDRAEARRLFGRLVELAPENVDYRIEAVEQLLRSGDVEGARRRVTRLLDRDLVRARRVRALELRGDVAWRAERRSRASSSYRAALSGGLPAATQRRIEAKLGALAAPPRPRSLGFAYLLGRHSAEIDVFFPTEWYRRQSDSALAAYLVGRRLWRAREWRRAARFLERARGGLEDRLLSAEVDRLYGRTLYALGRYDRARSVFGPLAEHSRSRYALEAEEWLRRIDTRRGNTDGGEGG